MATDEDFVPTQRMPRTPQHRLGGAFSQPCPEGRAAVVVVHGPLGSGVGELCDMLLVALGLPPSAVVYVDGDGGARNGKAFDDALAGTSAQRGMILDLLSRSAAQSNALQSEAQPDGLQLSERASKMPKKLILKVVERSKRSISSMAIAQEAQKDCTRVSNARHGGSPIVRGHVDRVCELDGRKEGADTPTLDQMAEMKRRVAGKLAGLVSSLFVVRDADVAFADDRFYAQLGSFMRSAPAGSLVVLTSAADMRALARVTDIPPHALSAALCGRIRPFSAVHSYSAETDVRLCALRLDCESVLDIGGHEVASSTEDLPTIAIGMDACCAPPTPVSHHICAPLSIGERAQCVIPYARAIASAQASWRSHLHRASRRPAT